jgi:hypothetical protein
MVGGLHMVGTGLAKDLHDLHTYSEGALVRFFGFALFDTYDTKLYWNEMD